MSDFIFPKENSGISQLLFNENFLCKIAIVTINRQFHYLLHKKQFSNKQL